MDLKKYDELRQKIHTKDFEGRNKKLDSWLYNLSFLGNIGSIFFAYFLVFPALNKAISTNLISGNFGFTLGLIITILLLISFEAIKRLLIRNLSFDLIKNKFDLFNAKIIGWLIFSISIIFLSFYFSINGAKNFATTSFENNKIAETNLNTQIDSLTNIYENKKNIFITDNINLKSVNTELRKKLAETPLNYRTVRKEYQINIDKNTDLIKLNQNKIDEIDDELDEEINIIKIKFNERTKNNKDGDFKNIILFILISTSIEVLIIVGIYFREYYEYNLYDNNKERLESIYKKRDRYKAMLAYIYQEGKVGHGTRIMASSKLIELVEENSTISDPKKFVETFLRDMENLDIFVVQGKRRLIQATYNEALNVIDNFDDAVRILENLK